MVGEELDRRDEDERPPEPALSALGDNLRMEYVPGCHDHRWTG